MKILLTGANGYIGKRLLPVLLEDGHEVYCCVRDKNRLQFPDSYSHKIKILETDFLVPSSLEKIPKDIDAAYYLIHSMAGSRNYEKPERDSAVNFRKVIDKTNVRQVIYLSGIINEKALSRHLTSRKNVEKELGAGKFHLTTLRAGIIIGSGSASFEIIRDLVEKLPLMVTPKWLNTRCQPIGVRDVIAFLSKTLFYEESFDKSFDIGGPDVMTYKEMLLGYAKARGLRRWIFTLPVMTPRLSSYWLFFITSTSYKLAVALVNSMKVEVVCRNDDLAGLLHIRPASYAQALERTLSAIDHYQILSGWKDSLASSEFSHRLSDFMDVPEHGCYIDKRTCIVKSPENSLERIWKIGGNNGWYYANSLWKIRGFLDKLAGGVGLRRGRTHPEIIHNGDVIDFWRVLYADKSQGRLLLFAEMKLPGEAWLEFRIRDNKLEQTATFRPKGLSGRLYWFLVYPFHGFIFKGMIRRIAL